MAHFIKSFQFQGSRLVASRNLARRYFSTTSPACIIQSGGPLSDNDQVNPDFENRNPRNLERMALDHKQEGWKYENPRRNYWYKVTLDTRDGINAKVIHCSGDLVVKASTSEFALAKFLFRQNDKTAAVTLARVLAERCKQCGIREMVLDPAIEDSVETEFKVQAFVETFLENGISLEEKRRIVQRYRPGVDYDSPEALQDLNERQSKVYNLGKEHRLAKKLATPSNMAHTVFKKWPEPPQNFDPKKDDY